MRISEELSAAISYAREEAMRTGSYTIGPDHLFLGLLRQGDNDATRFLSRSGIDLADCKRSIDAGIFHEHCIPYGDTDHVALSRSGNKLLNLAGVEALKTGDSQTRPLHLLLALCREGEGLCCRYLALREITTERIAAALPAPAPAIPDPDPDALTRLLSAIPVRTDTPS